MNAEPIRVVLNCDTKNEIDDQFAIAHALGLPPGTLDMRGVVSVHNTTADGPTSRDIYQEEAEKVVALCGSDVACLPGAEKPMETPSSPVESEGLDFLVEEARSGPLTIVATGPATDVASLLLVAPEVRENVRVVWLGGFGDKESYERHKMGGELNGRADIAAWRALFEDSVELLQVPGWSGPHKLVVKGLRVRGRTSVHRKPGLGLPGGDPRCGGCGERWRVGSRGKNYLGCVVRHRRRRPGSGYYWPARGADPGRRRGARLRAAGPGGGGVGGSR